MESYVIVTDCRNESSKLTTPFRAKHGAAAATLQPDGAAVAVPPALGPTASITARRYQGSTASWSTPRTKTLDQRRCCCLPQVVRTGIRFTEFRHGPFPNEW